MTVAAARRGGRWAASAAESRRVPAPRRAKATLPMPWNRPAMIGLSAKTASSDRGDPVAASARTTSAVPPPTTAAVPQRGMRRRVTAAAPSPTSTAMPAVRGASGQVPARHQGTSCAR